MSHLNWVDYTILAILFLSVLAGLMRGLVRELISLATLIAAFIIASMFASPLAVAFTSSSSVQNAMHHASSADQSVSYMAISVSFAVLFAGTLLAGAILGFFLSLAFRTGVLGFGNRLLGGVFGLARGFLLDLVLIFIVQLTAWSDQPTWQQSQLVAAFQPAVQWVGDVVSPSLAHLKEKYGSTLQK